MNIKNAEMQALLNFYYFFTADVNKISALHAAIMEEEGQSQQDIINAADVAFQALKDRKKTNNRRCADYVKEKRKVNKNYAR